MTHYEYVTVQELLALTEKMFDSLKQISGGYSSNIQFNDFRIVKETKIIIKAYEGDR